MTIDGVIRHLISVTHFFHELIFILHTTSVKSLIYNMLGVPFTMLNGNTSYCYDQMIKFIGSTTKLHFLLPIV